MKGIAIANYCNAGIELGLIPDKCIKFAGVSAVCEEETAGTGL